MGRKRIHPKKIDRLKIKKTEQPPPPEPEGTYGYKVTMTDGFGQFRDLSGAVDAKSSADVLEHVGKKLPEGWRLVKLAIAFIGVLVILFVR